MNQSLHFLTKKLEERKEQSLLRTLTTGERLIDFCSNDYLGIARNEELIQQIKSKIATTPDLLLGSGGSRLLAGNTHFTEQLEKELAQLHDTESALLFNSGYSANLSIFSSIPQKGDTIIYDEYIHACIKDGARLSFADRLSFKHNDVEDLRKKLSKANGKKFVAIESIYSMDGDQAPMIEIVALCKKFEAMLIVDEAHSTGLWGKSGAGLCDELNIGKDVFARIHTFGKGIGAHGACIASSETVKQYLINFARPFIYTTAMAEHSLITIQEAYHFIHTHPELWKTLQQKIALFCKNISVEKIVSNSPIQAILVPGNERVRKVASIIKEKGFDIRPILSPTVKKGSERIRVCLHAYNTDEEIKELISLLNETISKS